MKPPPWAGWLAGRPRLAGGPRPRNRAGEGDIRGAQARVIDFNDAAANDFPAVSRFTVAENRNTRQADVVLFVNGLPPGVIELKNPADAEADVWAAWNQLQTYKEELPSLFAVNELLMASDGPQARLGTLTVETLRATELQRSEREIEEESSRYESGQHQADRGDRRIGVVRHTRGAGKSLSMVCYAGAIARHPAMGNPTVVALTDRNDLDGQLFGAFARCRDLLRQEPAQAESRADLRRKLSVQSGGVVFTTIQKFYPGEQGDTCPTLSERRNVVVIADEDHRSQYDFIDGYAKHIRDALPNASFIGFTGFDAPNLRNVGIDRPLRENARANLRRMVRRTLNRHGYPPARQEQAIRTVVEQAELFPETLPG